VLTAERAIRSPITLVRSSIASIASAGTRQWRRRSKLKRTDSASGISDDAPYIGPSTFPRMRPRASATRKPGSFVELDDGSGVEIDRSRLPGLGVFEWRRRSHPSLLREWLPVCSGDSTTKNRSAALITVQPSKCAGATMN
jgi:hypothetical protein